MEKTLDTKHGLISLPTFFPTVGWPGGRGEYDFLFKNLDYFCTKIQHYNFLFNFSSFIFGFTIPQSDFHSQYESFKNRDMRDILVDNTNISSRVAEKLIILLDIGGNRIFNKIVADKLPPVDICSYKKYLDAYEQFIKTGNPDIFVNFDIGPSYTTKDEISKQGIRIWNKLSEKERYQINQELLKISINYKNDSLLMVPINAINPLALKKSLEYLFKNYSKKVDILGLGGIANCPVEAIKQSLQVIDNFKNENKWDILCHGLGLGGWQNIPLLVKYGVYSCDVASPWRRACTDAISHPYLPLFDQDLNFTDIANSFSHLELYDELYATLRCTCPFCKDLPINEIRERCKKADKKYTKQKLHDEDFREMRIRIFFHNVYQHIALLKKLYYYKTKFGNDFMKTFLKDMPNGRAKRAFLKLNI